MDSKPYFCYLVSPSGHPALRMRLGRVLRRPHAYSKICTGGTHQMACAYASLWSVHCVFVPAPGWKLLSAGSLAEDASFRRQGVPSCNKMTNQVVGALPQVVYEDYCLLITHGQVYQVADTRDGSAMTSYYPVPWFHWAVIHNACKGTNCAPLHSNICGVSLKCHIFQSYKMRPSKRANRTLLVCQCHNPTSHSRAWTFVSVWKSRPKYCIHVPSTQMCKELETVRHAAKRWWSTPVWRVRTTPIATDMSAGSLNWMHAPLCYCINRGTRLLNCQTMFTFGPLLQYHVIPRLCDFRNTSRIV